jgi:hypothetical protein
MAAPGATDAMRQAKNGRIGTIMVTPTKLPANDSLSPLMRSVAISSGLLAFGLVVALSLPTSQSATAPSEAARSRWRHRPARGNADRR